MNRDPAVQVREVRGLNAPWSDPDHDVMGDLRDAASKAVDDHAALLRERYSTPPGYPVP